MTQVFHVTNPDDPALEIAAAVLREGGTVVFPTETVYGLGANALSETAIQGIYKAKGRPSDNPLIVHISNWSQLEGIVHPLTPEEEAVARRFWPGPLTLILRKKDAVPSSVTAGLSTVAVRMPEHPIAAKLIELSGVPVAAPSANISGKPSPTRGVHVLEDLNGRVDVIVWGDDSPVGLESTVLDMTVTPPVVLRPGGLPIEALRTILPTVSLDPALASKNAHLVPKSPGMKYTHYAPDAELVLYEGPGPLKVEAIHREAMEQIAQGKVVGILTTSEHAPEYQSVKAQIRILGSEADPESLAKHLFSELREFNQLQVDLILAEGVEEAGIGQAVMNRLRKAATRKVSV